MSKIPWLDSSMPFLNYLEEWYRGLEARPLSEFTTSPSQVGIISVDVINGFCHEGVLASPRVKAIIAPIVSLLERAWEAGVRNIVFTQDTHEPEAVEFAQFPPHCIRGTSEAETVPELKALPFFEHIKVFEKNSIQSGLNTGLDEWVRDHPQVDQFLIVGDCTDLCTYQLAMHLRLQANALQLTRRVILPVNCVDTYDLPVETARELGAVPHDAELIHRVFLYHMMLNGIEVVAALD